MLAALRAEVGILCACSDPCRDKLRTAIAARHVCRPGRFRRQWSDEVLAHVLNALLKHGAPCCSGHHVQFYPVYAGCRDRVCTRCAQCRVPDRVGDYARPNGGIIFPIRTRPRAVVPGAEIERVLKANAASVVVIDEAYVRFRRRVLRAADSTVSATAGDAHASKSHALAGLRVGMPPGTGLSRRSIA